MTYIPYSRQHINQEDIQAVTEVLQSLWLTQGPTIPAFEKAVADYCGAKYAVAVNSATSALHIACKAAGLGEGDMLWTSPNTFVASANCGLYCGAAVDFVDIDPLSYNLSDVKLAEKLTDARRAGALPKVVIPVHFAGQSCDMEAIARQAKEYGITVIEDASHAIGSEYKGHKIGCCEYSAMTVFSFHPVKIITSGEGGMVLTNSEELYQKLILLRSHGITRDAALMHEDMHGPWYYEQVELGFNYRMTDIQASLGLSQIKRLDEFIAWRRKVATRYDAALQGLPVIRPWQSPNSNSAYHLYVICLETDKLQKTHRQIFEELRAAGIMVNLHYIPVHTQPYYRRMGFNWGDFPTAENYYRRAVSIPVYYGLTDTEQDYVIDKIKEVVT